LLLNWVETLAKIAVFVRKYLNGISPYRQDTSKADILAASIQALKQMSEGNSRIWDDLRSLKKLWDGPIVLKGIQTLEDAKWGYIFTQNSHAILTFA
jgi:isopentenyl diphosphate isomerase/L-lactate dehydrogenase-like FMN-dependent dehydrogenase